MKIPKTITIAGAVYTIEYNDVELLKYNGDGACTYRDRKIFLSENKLMSKNYSDYIFIHELLHAIFDTIGEPILCKNEELIDRMSNVLQQILPQIEGK